MPLPAKIVNNHCVHCAWLELSCDGTEGQGEKETRVLQGTVTSWHPTPSLLGNQGQHDSNRNLCGSPALPRRPYILSCRHCAQQILTFRGTMTNWGDLSSSHLLLASALWWLVTRSSVMTDIRAPVDILDAGKWHSDQTMIPVIWRPVELARSTGSHNTTC